MLRVNRLFCLRATKAPEFTNVFQAEVNSSGQYPSPRSQDRNPNAGPGSSDGKHPMVIGSEQGAVRTERVAAEAQAKPQNGNGAHVQEKQSAVDFDNR